MIMTRTTKSRKTSKMDASPYTRVRRGGGLMPVSSNARGLYKAVPNFSRKPQFRRVQHQPDSIDELASALLDDSSLEQQVTPTTPQAAVGLASQSPLPIERYTVQPSLAAMVQNNITAFETNRMLVSPPSRKPSKTLRSRASVRQSNGYVTRVQVAQCGNASRRAGSTRERMMGNTDVYDKPVTHMVVSGTENSNIITSQITSQQEENEFHELNNTNLPNNYPRQGNRRSVAGPVTERPKEGNLIHRSKTMHASRKTGLSKQKSVLQKMTDAITDRLHLSSKNGDLETNGDYAGEHEMDKILTEVIEVQQVQVRKQSTRSGVVKLESLQKKVQPQAVVMGPWNCRSSRRSMSLISDPFFVRDCGTEHPNDFLIRLRASFTTDASWCTPNRSTTESLVSLMKGSLSSHGGDDPAATSSPRVQIPSPLGEVFNKAKGVEALLVRSVHPVTLGGPLISETPSEQSDQERNEEDDEGENDVGTEGLSPVPVYRYPTGGPVAAARASDRKKHPSPSKDDLAILAYKFTVLRESKREEARRQASPLGHTPGMQRHRTESEVLNRYIVERLRNEGEHEDDDDLDELAPDCVLASLAKPTVNKRKAIAVTGLTIPRLAPPVGSRHRALSIQQGCYSPATLPDCACHGSNLVALETDCPLHGGMAELNELQWTDPSYNLVPRHVC